MLPLAFTGHRKINSSYKLTPVLMSNLRQTLQETKSWGFDEFRCGMAVGSDTYFAETVLELGLPLFAYLPFKGLEAKWPQVQRVKFNELLSKVIKVKYVSEPPYYAWKMFLRDKVMVENTGMVLSIWDGREEGGTWKTIQYAREFHIPIYNLWPDGRREWLSDATIGK